MKKYDTPEFNMVTFDSEQVLLDTTSSLDTGAGLLNDTLDYNDI